MLTLSWVEVDKEMGMWETSSGYNITISEFIKLKEALDPLILI